MKLLKKTQVNNKASRRYFSSARPPFKPQERSVFLSRLITKVG